MNCKIKERSQANRRHRLSGKPYLPPLAEEATIQAVSDSDGQPSHVPTPPLVK